MLFEDNVMKNEKQKNDSQSVSFLAKKFKLKKNLISFPALNTVS